ncbi:MAG TPA: TonB C-terminal domain-containing protein [Gemmatimonadaceae bacterium]|nr:TonB C-terminal domain-containing protein [Gemmatimonadaceae bacterium]
MTLVAPRDDLSLRTPLVLSALLHLLVAAGFLVSRARAPVATPPMYRVSLIAAPPGPRQIGVVRETPPEPTPTPPAPTPLSRATPEPERMKAPTKAPPARTPKVATPNAGAPTTKAPPAPKAGGGPTGGRGADVANVRTEGIEFPYPVYLQNVVRQIALQFKPSGNGALRAEVAFLIRRDGSISALKLVTRSGAFSFDQDAMGAVEAAARANAFGPLPQGFTDDVLPVIFSFDPRLIR